MPMTFSLPNIIKLGGIELTDEGRDPLQTTLDQREVIVQLANGSIKKYVKGKHWRKWTINWSNVPATTTDTVDGHGGRTEIKELAFTPGAFTLMVQETTVDEEEYVVFVESYDEEILRRRTEAGGTRYRVTLNLIEASIPVEVII